MTEVSKKSEFEARKRTFEFPVAWGLSGQEARMLGCIMVNGTASYRDIHMAISRRDDTGSNMVRVVASTLRTKLRISGAPVTVDTQRNFGFSIASPRDLNKWLADYRGPKMAVQLHRGPKAYWPPIARKKMAEAAK